MSHNGLRSFLAEFWRFDRRAASITLALNLLGAVLEGMVLMLLLPLAAIFSGHEGAGPANCPAFPF